MRSTPSVKFGYAGLGARKRGRIVVELKKYDSFDNAISPGAPAQTPAGNSFQLNFNNQVATGNNVRAIFTPLVGSGINQRIGRRVQVKSIQCRGYVQPAEDVAYPDFLRFMVVLDMQPNATGPNVTPDQVLGQGTGQTSHSMSFNNLDNRARFKTLMDWKMVTQVAGDQTGASITPLAAGAHNMIIDWYKKFNFPVTFNNGDTGIPNDITTAKIIVLCSGVAPGGLASGQWLVNLTTRVRYTDV